MMLLRLRQGCNHPALIRRKKLDPVGFALLERAKRLPFENSGGICGIYSHPSDIAVITNCGHVFCFECMESWIDNSLEYRRLNGRMSLALNVMFMSLKAGYLGLNIVAANYVILLDPWWNSTTEDQAVDQAHRIGQTRPITVTRLTVQETVEDRILALQEKKRLIVASAPGAYELGLQDAFFLPSKKGLFNGISLPPGVDIMSKSAIVQRPVSQVSVSIGLGYDDKFPCGSSSII